MVHDIHLLQLQIGWIVFAKALLSLQHWLSWKTMLKHSSVLPGNVLFWNCNICFTEQMEDSVAAHETCHMGTTHLGCALWCCCLRFALFWFHSFLLEMASWYSHKLKTWVVETAILCHRIKHPKKSTSFPERFVWSARFVQHTIPRLMNCA